MKVVLFGATGNVGRRVAAEALSRGHEVVGVGREPAAGRSFITFEDYAVAVLDELERPQHVGRRFGVAY